MDLEFNCKLALNFDQVYESVKKAAVKSTAKCAALVEAEAKRSLSKGGKGKGAAKFGDKKVPTTYKSSPPGDPPFLRTGNLRASIKSAETPTGTYVVGPTRTAWYGRIHERETGLLIKVTPKMRGFLFYQFGWRVKKAFIFIPPRPFMRPALKKVAARFPQLFKDLPIGGS